jgi:hypothetical protein
MAGWMKSSGGSCWPGVMRISGSAGWFFRRRDSTWPGFSDDVAAQWQPAGEDNTRRFGGLLAPGGWPGRTLAGEEGAQAAWLLAQHADRDPVLHRAFLEALRGALAHRGGLPRTPGLPAGQGAGPCRAASALWNPVHRQRRRIRPYLIENPQRLDEPSAAAGLEPFAIYQA